ncbi:MAG: ATP-binding protein [Oscillochloridaceae bacterium umkhey_bin13]
MVRFINREQELKALNAKLQAFQSDVLPEKRLFNLYGPAGIGKTALLDYFINIQVKKQAKIPVIRIDYDDFGKLISYHENQRQILMLLKTKTASLVNRTSAEQSLTDDTYDQQLEAIAEDLRQHASQRPLLLCFDHSDGLDEALFAWIERRLLLPLANDRPEQPVRVLCLFTSQLLLRWRQFNVRRRVEPIEIKALDQYATLQQALVSLAPDYAPTMQRMPSQFSDHTPYLESTIYQFSFGLPAATQTLVEQLQAVEPVYAPEPGFEQVQLDRMRTWLDEHKATLITTITQQIIDRVSPQIQPILQRTSETKHEWIGWNILEAVSLLREFDVNSMRVMLGQYNSTIFDNPSQALLLAYLRDLIETRLVIWESSIRAYQVVAPVRQIFARQLELHQPEQYVRMRKEAAGFYKQQVKTVVSYRHRYIIEYLFQSIHTPAFHVDHVPALKQLLRYYLETYYGYPGSMLQARDDIRSQELALFREDLTQDTELLDIIRGKTGSLDLIQDVVQVFHSSNITTNKV